MDNGNTTSADWLGDPSVRQRSSFGNGSGNVIASGSSNTSFAVSNETW
jgi:hypothetical protein